MKPARTYLRDNALTLALLLVCAALTIALLRRGGGQSGAVAVDPAAVVGSGPIPQTTDSEQNLLDRVIPELNLGEQPKLGEAFDVLARSGHCRINVNWKVLEADGFGRDEPAAMTGIHKNITIGQAIQHILVYGAKFAAIDNTIYISNELEFSYHKQTLVYNVRDIFDAAAQTAAGDSEPDVIRRHGAANLLTWLLVNYISSDSWRDNGGNIGSVTEINGLLVISQTPDNHRAIAEFLRQLRQTSRTGIPAIASARATGKEPPTDPPSDPALATLSKMLPPLPPQRPQTLGEALQLIQNVSGQQILVEWSQLIGAGIEPKMQIDLAWPPAPMTVGECLKVILASSADSLRVTRQGNLIIITTEDELRRYTRLAGYNIRDLIETMIKNRRSDPAREAPLTHQEAVDRLMKALVDTIDPDSWRDNGGDIGSIEEIMGVLVIQQTAENQDAIRKMLDDLRKANGTRRGSFIAHAASPWAHGRIRGICRAWRGDRSRTRRRGRQHGRGVACDWRSMPSGRPR
jgi:hypothetical protein